VTASSRSLLFIYRPRKDERLSWPSWLTCSGRFTHIGISGHPSAVGWAQDSESSPVKDLRSTTEPRNQPSLYKTRSGTSSQSSRCDSPWSYFLVPVTIRAAAFRTRWRLLSHFLQPKCAVHSGKLNWTGSPNLRRPSSVVAGFRLTTDIALICRFTSVSRLWRTCDDRRIVAVRRRFSAQRETEQSPVDVVVA